MTDDVPKRFTLLYQLFLAGQASRRFMKAALAGTGLTGEQYALYSYLYGNGPRTLSQAARDFGLAVTTVATMLAPHFASGELERLPHPTDRRARLIALTDSGRRRMDRASPAFTDAYHAVVRELEREGGDVEAMYEALDRLRASTTAEAERLEVAASRSA
ncbi:MAG TPA: MarR family winged helix-turn-helix transcriptional regulator [Candidatus Limnocylindrales bacterium]|nr:MarR family winged helix-turn-helix transcriptional regulator [Candidatus Limnocylindrales bacterium]